jgi:hypothetical protein
MSALGQKRTSGRRSGASACRLKADMLNAGANHVRFGSLADIGGLIGNVRFTPQSGHLRRSNRCSLRARNGLSQISSTSTSNLRGVDKFAAESRQVPEAKIVPQSRPKKRHPHHGGALKVRDLAGRPDYLHWLELTVQLME